MDTSDTSDFESADEFFSDSEDVAKKEDETKSLEDKIETTEGKLVEESGEMNIPDFEKPQQCWEPRVDYDIEKESLLKYDAIPDKDVKEIIAKESSDNKQVINKEVPSETIEIQPDVQIPPIRTTCWIPELHEANIKREPTDFIPGPPKFDRDGNPINKPQKPAEGKNEQISPQEKLQIPRIRTTCWIPALNEANKQRRENEKHPPKPPTVDRDGNPLKKPAIAEKNKVATKSEIPEDKDSLYETDETWASREEAERKKGDVGNKITKNEQDCYKIDEVTKEIEIQKSEKKLVIDEKLPDEDKDNLWETDETWESPEDVEVKKEEVGIKIAKSEEDCFKNDKITKEIVEEPEKKLEIEKKNPEDKDNLWETEETWEGHDDLKTKNDVVESKDCSKISNDDLKLLELKKDTEENLWDNDDQWEVENLPDPPNNEPEKSFKTKDDLWKDNFDSWGVDDDKQETLKKAHKEQVKPESSISSDDNMWENDQWESIEKEPSTAAEEIKPLGEAWNNLTNQQSWSNWGNWGISSVLHTVSQGLTTVIGVPDPEDLARQHLAQKELLSSPAEDDMLKEFAVEESGDSFVGLGTLVSGVTKLVETTGTKVISGGLGTLETIGKKTMEVLQENDPGLKKKRAFLKKIEPEKPVLSQVLREAKEKAEMTHESMLLRHKMERPVNYDILFDDYQGLMHLEALSMISRQCSIKLSTITSHLSGAALADLQETLDQVKELCELPTEDADLSTQTTDPTELNEALLTAIADLNVPISFAGLVEAWRELDVNQEGQGATGIHRRGVETLARFTAMAVEQMHKAGEMLLVKEHRSTVDEADSLVQISSMVISMLNTITSQFTDSLSELSSEECKEDINQHITNVFFESSNSTQYIQQAFQLLIPVLQVGAT